MNIPHALDAMPTAEFMAIEFLAIIIVGLLFLEARERWGKWRKK